jgi:hypothetical protein
MLIIQLGHYDLVCFRNRWKLEHTKQQILQQLRVGVKQHLLVYEGV